MCTRLYFKVASATKIILCGLGKGLLGQNRPNNIFLNLIFYVRLLINNSVVVVASDGSRGPRTTTQERKTGSVHRITGKGTGTNVRTSFRRF